MRVFFEVGGGRDVDFLGAEIARRRFDSGNFAVERIAGRGGQRTMGDCGGLDRQRHVRRIGAAAKIGEQRAGITERKLRTALAQIVGDARRQPVEINDADRRVVLFGGDLLRGFQSDPRRVQHLAKTADALDPGFDAKAQRRDQIRQAFGRQH